MTAARRASVSGTVLCLAAFALRGEDSPAPGPRRDDAWREQEADVASHLRDLRDRLSEEAGEHARSWGSTLIVNRDPAAQEELAAATAAARQSAWRDAAALLQKLCDRPAGSLVVDPGDPRVVIPAHRAAERMLRAGPPELLAAWRAEQEAPARRLVQEALKKRDMARLAEAARRWGAAAAGEEARALLVKILAASGDVPGALRVLSETASPAGVKEPVWLSLIEETARSGDPAMTAWLRAAAAGCGALGKEAEARIARLEAEARKALLADHPRGPVLGVKPLWEYRVGPELMHLESARPVPSVPVLGTEAVFLQGGRRLTIVERATGRLMAQSGASEKPYVIDYGPQVLHSAVPGGARVLVTLPDASPVYDHKISAVVSLPTQDLHAFDAATGKLLWRAKDASAGKEPSIRPEESFPALPCAAGDSVYAPVVAFKGLFSVSVACLAAADGTPRWRTFLCSGQQEMNYFGRPVREAVPSAPALAGGRLFVSTNLGAVAALDPRTGDPLWLFQYDQVPQKNQETRMFDIEPRLSGWKAVPPVCLGRTLLVAPTDSPYLYALDAATGRMLWRHEGQGANGFQVDAASGTVFVWGRERGTGLSAADGTLKWRSVLRARSVHPGNASGGRFYVVADGRLTGFDAASGRVTCLVEDLPCAGPVAVDGRFGVTLSMNTLAAWELVEESPGRKPDR